MNALLEMPTARSVRRTARFACQVVRLRDFSLVADLVENVSPEGLLVGPADPVLTGEELIVSFRLPGIRDYIDAEAVVSRVVHGRRPGESRRALGITFTAISPFSQMLLNAYIRRLPPIPPSFRRGIWRGKFQPLSGPLFAQAAAAFPSLCPVMP